MESVGATDHQSCRDTVRRVMGCRGVAALCRVTLQAVQGGSLNQSMCLLVHAMGSRTDAGFAEAKAAWVLSIRALGSQNSIGPQLCSTDLE